MSTTPSTDKPVDDDPVAAAIIAYTKDITLYWHTVSPVTLTVKAGVYPTTADAPCTPSKPTVPAFTCPLGQEVAFIEPTVQREFYDKAGELGVGILAGHEIAHLMMPKLNPVLDTNDGTEERRADCFSGSYMRWALDSPVSTFHYELTDQEIMTTVQLVYKNEQRQQDFTQGYVNAGNACKGQPK